jgi:exonuclease SbcD
LTQHISDSLAHIIAQLAATLDATIPSILVGHLTVSAGIFSGSEKRAVYGHDPIVLPSQLAILPFDYIALGHLHRFQNVNPDGLIPIIYSGSIDRIDFGERKEEKGFCDVTIHGKQQTTFKQIIIPTRPFLQIDVVLQPDIDSTQQILDRLSAFIIKDAIVKITYELHAQGSDNVDVKQIQKYCSDAMYLVGIIPIRTASTRAHRDLLKQEMNLETLLQTYFESQDSLKKRSNELTQKALRLEEFTELYDSCSEPIDS